MTTPSLVQAWGCISLVGPEISTDPATCVLAVDMARPLGPPHTSKWEWGTANRVRGRSSGPGLRGSGRLLGDVTGRDRMNIDRARILIAVVSCTAHPDSGLYSDITCDRRSDWSNWGDNCWTRHVRRWSDLRRLVCVGNNEMVEMVAAVKESLCPIPHSTAWHSDHTCLTKKMEE